MKEITYILEKGNPERSGKRLKKLARAAFYGCLVDFETVTGKLTVSIEDANDIAKEEKKFLDAARSNGWELIRFGERHIPGMSLLALEEKEEEMADSQRTRTRKRKSGNSAVTAAICLLVAVVSALSAWAVTSGVYDRKLAEIGSDLSTDRTFHELDFLHELFLNFSYYDLDEQTLIEAVLKAYTEATGDVYAQYYTKEEFEALNADNAGDVQGIGVSVTNTTVSYHEAVHRAIQIIAVFNDSPAMAAGVRSGDLIVAVGSSAEEKSVNDIGYETALSALRGESGSYAAFKVWRPNGDGTFQELSFSVRRDHVQSESVAARVCATDSRVGIVRLMQFDLTTPMQFRAAMAQLQAAGCEYFIFDVRDNPGGDLRSIEAVLSYFLEKGDLMVTTKDSAGNTTADYVKAVTYAGDYAGCSVAESEIGSYRGLPCAVLTNGNTASAAELFTATMRDYDLATLVGTKTFGKGCMQSVIALSTFGYEGGVKLTTKMYFSKCGVSYHDIGIAPDLEIALSQEAAAYHLFLLPDALDDQLLAAIEAIEG